VVDDQDGAHGGSISVEGGGLHPGPGRFPSLRPV
jgi:hypothetical protein